MKWIWRPKYDLTIHPYINRGVVHSVYAAFNIHFGDLSLIYNLSWVCFFVFFVVLFPLQLYRRRQYQDMLRLFFAL